MDQIFLMDRSHWVKAALHHFAVWERKERLIFYQMIPRVSLEGIASAGGYYRVARHFPIRKRSRLLTLINGVTPSGGSVQQRFDAFVRSVRKLANEFPQEFGADRRTLRPISGMSKFLWYRFPYHGFIYDSQVLAAVCKNRLTVRFDSMIDAFGGRPSDHHEWNFVIAAAAYRTFALPLHAIIADTFKDHNLEPERAARLVDTLFWLEGGPKTSVEDSTKSERALAEAMGNEAFMRCEAKVASLIGSA